MLWEWRPSSLLCPRFFEFGSCSGWTTLFRLCHHRILGSRSLVRSSGTLAGFQRTTRLVVIHAMGVQSQAPGIRQVIVILDASHTIREQHSPLVGEASKGNAEALTALLESARPIVYRWAALRTRDLDDAEDVTQLVLLRLFSGLPTFRGESRLSSWLYRVTLNEISGFFRKQAREQAQARMWCQAELHDLTTCCDPDRIDHQRAAGMVRDAASTLPPLQQAAFRLVDLDGLRPCEAARELGKTQSSIRSSLCRARKKIRELVKECRQELVLHLDQETALRQRV